MVMANTAKLETHHRFVVHSVVRLLAKIMESEATVYFADEAAEADLAAIIQACLQTTSLSAIIVLSKQMVTEVAAVLLRHLLVALVVDVAAQLQLASMLFHHQQALKTVVEDAAVEDLEEEVFHVDVAVCHRCSLLSCNVTYRSI